MPVTTIIPTISEYRELALSAGVADNISDMLLVGGHLYGITATSPSRIIKIDKGTFAYEVATFTNDGDHVNASDIVYVPSNGKLYVAFPISGRLLITEVDPASLIMTDRVNEVTADAGVVSMATDDSYLYVLMQAAGNIVTMRQYDLGFLGHIDPDLSGVRGADGLAFFGAGVYFIGWPNGAEATQTIYRVDAADLSVSSAAIASVGASIRRLHHSVVVSGRLFFCSEDVANKIVVIELNNLTSQLLNFSAAGDHSALVSDGSSVWNLRDNGLAVKINPSTLETSIYTLNAGQGYLSELEGDGIYLYASFFQAGTKIARYHIAHDSPDEPALVGFLSAVGVANDVVVRDGYAFLATETFGLAVVDVSNPNMPVLVSTADRPFNGSKVVLSGPIACVTGRRIFHSSPGVATSVGVFYIINVTDPSRPWVMGYIEEGYFNGAAIAGNYAYSVRGLGGVSVIDISNKTQPSIVGSYDTPGGGFGIAVAGNFAYVADGQSGLRILDISSPTAPSSIGSIDTPGNTQGAVVVDSLAYLADISSFRVVDISTPSAPSARGNLSISAVDIKVEGSMAYAAIGSSGLRSVNIANPDSPAQLGSIAAFGASSPSTNGVFPVGSYAYLANGNGGLGIVNISNPAAMSQVSSLREWFSGTKLASKTGLIVLVGNHLSSGGQTSVNGLRVINTSNPAAPSVVGQLEVPALTFLNVRIAGNLVYAACGSDGVKVIDISNPALPTIVGSCDTPGSAQSIVIAGNYAYVADGTGGLRILDITNPTAPVSVGGVITPVSAVDVAIEGTLAYVADYNDLQIVDVSNPAVPTLRGSLSLLAFEVKVGGGIAYLAGASSGLIAVDVTNPDSPRQVSSVRPVGAYNPTTTSIDIDGSTAYVANGAGGLAIIDISNPSSLRLHSTAPALGYTRSVISAGRWIYLSDSLAGINIFDVG